MRILIREINSPRVRVVNNCKYKKEIAKKKKLYSLYNSVRVYNILMGLFRVAIRWRATSQDYVRCH